MDNEQITTLARECAEGNPKIADLKTAYKCEYKKAYEYMLRFLLRRYCLVEKDKVRKWTGVKLRLPEIDQRVLICERVANQYKIFIGRRIALSNGGWEWNQSTKESVVAWMPLPKYPQDLGKEVEE